MSVLQTIKQNKSFLLVNHNYDCVILLAQKKCSQVVWFHSTSIFQRLYFYFMFDCLVICFQCVILFMEHQYSTFHETSNKDDNRTAQWNSSGPGFYLKIDAVFYSCIISSFISRYMFLWE